jgi:hypothetical protein
VGVGGANMFLLRMSQLLLRTSQCMLGGATFRWGLNSHKSLNLTNVYPNININKNKNKKNNNYYKVKSKPLELFELAGKNYKLLPIILKIVVLGLYKSQRTVCPEDCGGHSSGSR